MTDDAADPVALAELERLKLERDSAERQILILLTEKGPRSAEYLAALSRSAKLLSEIQWLQRGG